MSHPYGHYINTKADEYYARQIHESLCDTQLPNAVPTGPYGQTYDVYVIRHCNCWLSTNWEDLTLARKFEALRDLSRRYGLHSGACSRLKRTPITYRNKPEFLTYGCDCWLSVDMQPDSPVEYEQQPKEQRKDHIMGDLSKAQNLAEAAEQAQRDIDNFLAPFIKGYTEFLTEESARGYDARDFKADTFVEVEGVTFAITGEEDYIHGEYYTPSLSLPFTFVENPQQFKEDFRAMAAAVKEKAAAKKVADKAAMVERLKAQLARAEAELSTASVQKDSIRTIATRNREQKLLAELANSHEQE